MRKIVFNILFVVAIASFLFPCVCYSRVITIGFTAQVTGVSDIPNILGGEIKVGDLINGTYTYDTSMPSTSHYSEIRYSFSSPPAGITASIGNFVFISDPNNTGLSVRIGNGISTARDIEDRFKIISSQNLMFYKNILCNIPKLEISMDFLDWRYESENLLSTILSVELPATAIIPSYRNRLWIYINGFVNTDQQSTEYFGISSRLISANPISNPPKIIYVDDDASGLNDGTSWENAYIFLQDAIADANNSDKPVEIRAADGIYQPDMGAGINHGDREASFHLMSEVSIKGGFAGLSGLNPDVQNIQLYKTILTGDLNSDDVPGFANRNDNSYHVLSAIDVDDSAYIEGLFITGGNADGLPENVTDPSQRRDDHSISGGGLYIYNGRPVIESCKFKDNYAYGYGGGIYLSGAARVLNCTFSGNKAKITGGVFYGVYSSEIRSEIIFKGCILQGNTNAFGGMQSSFLNSTLADNDYDSPYINCRNCIIWNHEQNVLIYPRYNILWYSDSCYSKYFDTGNINSDPLFAAPGHWDNNNTPEDANDDFWIEGDYHLKSQAGRFDPNTQSWVQDDVTSPCIDAGDPNSPIGLEPFPNGGYINMGAYGGTSQASKSYFDKPLCNTIVAGDINGDCKVDETDMEILMLHWLEEDIQY